MLEWMNKYKVPFFVWANYDMEEQVVDCTSLNFLSNYIYEVAGMDLPVFNQFTKDVQEIIPAMNSLGYYSKEKDQYVSYDEAVGEEADIIEDYMMLQYNRVFDEDGKSELFFGRESR